MATQSASTDEPRGSPEVRNLRNGQHKSKTLTRPPGHHRHDAAALLPYETSLGRPECHVAGVIELHMGEGDRLVGLIQEGIDCVLRVGNPEDSDMVARRVGLLEEVTCAGANYVGRFGTPQTIEALDGHRMVGFHSSATGGLLPLEFLVDGITRTITLPAALSVNAAESYVAAARLGLGLIQVPRYHVENDLASGALVQLLPDHPPTPSPVSLLYPETVSSPRAFASSSTGWCRSSLRGTRR